LLDDAGVVFYAKKVNSRRPEDVERVGGWFSGYLKGFLGISAIVSYVRFILESPITASTGIATSTLSSQVYAFVFGFPIISGLTIGLLALVMHEFMLPHNTTFLYERLSKRKVAMRTSEIQINKKEELSADDIVKGYLEVGPKVKMKKIKTKKIKTKKVERDESPPPDSPPSDSLPPTSPPPISPE